MEYAIRIGFKFTNNKAKYESFLARLRVTTKLGVESLDAFSDSQLVVNQVQGDYLTQDIWMVAYLDEVKSILMKIKDFKIIQISKEEHKKVNSLANLASIFNFISYKSISLEFLPNSSINVAKNICRTTIDPTWMDNIVAFFRDETLP